MARHSGGTMFSTVDSQNEMSVFSFYVKFECFSCACVGFL